jgi:hypothetical protein
MKNRVGEKLELIETQLSTFPEQSSAPCMEVANEIDGIVAALVNNIRGDPPHAVFRNKYNRLHEKLFQKLKSMRPDLSFVTPGYKPPAFNVDSDDDEVSASPAPTPKSRKGNDGRAIATPVRNAQPSARTPVKQEANKIATTASKKVFKLDEIQRHYASGARRLPDTLSPKVTDDLTLQCITAWPGIFQLALNDIKMIVGQMLANTIQTVLQARQGTLLFSEVRDTVESLFIELFEKEEASFKHALACELHKPLVNDEATHRVNREAKKDQLLKSRALQRLDEHFDPLEATGAKGMKPEERKKKVTEQPAWVSGLLGPDPFTNIISEMATPFAYYDMATARITDVLGLHLEYGLFHTFEEQLKARLREGLDVMNPAHCAALLAEDAAREEHRRSLLAEKRKLTAALDELHNLSQLL